MVPLRRKNGALVPTRDTTDYMGAFDVIAVAATADMAINDDLMHGDFSVFSFFSVPPQQSVLEKVA